MGVSWLQVVREGNFRGPGRILALDYGRRRCGLAVTDPLRLIAGPLKALRTVELRNFLKDYFRSEPIVGLVVGYSTHRDGTPVEHERDIEALLKWLLREFPSLGIYRLNERYTSKMASHALAEAGARRGDRQNKGHIDVVSAILLLQDFLQFYKCGTKND